MRIRIIGAVVALLLAVVGGVAIYVYVRAADQRAQAGAEFVEVYVVTEPIPAGAGPQVVAERIEVQELPRMAVLEDGVTSLEDLDGLVTSTELLPGEQLIQARFVSPADLAAQGDVPVPDGLQEVTVALPVQRVVGGAIVPGSQVGVVVSANVPQATTKFVYNRVLVTRIQPGETFTSAAEGDDSGPVETIMVTFATDAPTIEKLVWAAELQEEGEAGIWLTLQPEAANLDGSRPVTGSNILQ